MNEKLISHLLTDHAECNLHELAPLTVSENRKTLTKMREKFIKQGELPAAQKLSQYLQSGLTKKELEKIITTSWRKHRVEFALKAIDLLLKTHPLSGLSVLQQALDKCLAGAKSSDYYYRPRYQAAIPKIMAMTKN